MTSCRSLFGTPLMCTQPSSSAALYQHGLHCKASGCLVHVSKAFFLQITVLCLTKSIIARKESEVTSSNDAIVVWQHNRAHNISAQDNTIPGVKRVHSCSCYGRFVASVLASVKCEIGALMSSSCHCYPPGFKYEPRQQRLEYLAAEQCPHQDANSSTAMSA